MKDSTHYKIVGAIFFLGIGTIISGALYGHFCTDKILAREQYLADVAHQLTPPAGAVKISEEAWRKGFSMHYYIRYRYEKSADEAMKQYMNVLENQMYSIETITKNRLEARKKGLVLTVRVDLAEKKIYASISLDDIFGKLRI